ncbi:uncharacterized protein MYCGRDRAFT_109292 [Zymoseptoria tritici IPO323]|uniref:Uncharacterized protein n=1 Tax=Zymoseptoria tritici (strain CBS 115943 / IPO323) TaxID=336722 RepID=F9X8M2_ZYMTI|nr:uncharacterized protein MYCGRDRAFT_109292 [Zymoseptoria tritici IPO323]EGP88114.1 hypothetical protein MYCGRDRAFT_109292 [Zymoseptoria tritici IPO323]
MLSHVADLTGRGEEDEELVMVVRWLLGKLDKAVEDAESRNLAWDSSPDNAWYAPSDHPFTNREASHAYDTSQQSIPHTNVTTAEAARAAYISKMWDIMDKKLTEMHLEMSPIPLHFSLQKDPQHRHYITHTFRPTIMDRFNMQNLQLDQITTPTSTKLRNILVLLNDKTIFWALQSRLVALQWTVEGYKDLAHKIMYQVTERLLDEAGMRLYLSDMTGRGEEDGELVGIAHWLFNEAPSDSSLQMKLEWQDSEAYAEPVERECYYEREKDEEGIPPRVLLEPCTGDAGMEAEKGF